VNKVCQDPVDKRYATSTESRNIPKYNTYEKCTFRSDYDHVNLRRKLSSETRTFDKEFDVIYTGEKDFNSMQMD
jgi:hypothetical protein